MKKAITLFCQTLKLKTIVIFNSNYDTVFIRKMYLICGVFLKTSDQTMY